MATQGASAAPGLSAEFELECEDDKGHIFSWRGSNEAHAPLQRLVSSWLKEHVSGSDLMATLRDPQSDDIIDLRRTPHEVWGASQTSRTLWIEPLPLVEAATLAASANKPTESLADASLAKLHGAASVAASPAKQLPAISPSKRSAAEPASSSQSTPAAEVTPDAKRAKTAELAKATAAAVAEPQQAQAKEVAPASASAPAKAVMQAKAPVPAKAHQAAAPAKAAAAKSTAWIRTRGVGKPPAGDDSIEFESPNPKNATSNSGIRYGLYMKAKTVAEALSLGAAKGDIKNDWDKGYLRRGA